MMVEDPDDLDVDGREVYVKSNPPKRISVREVAHEAIFGARGDGYTPAGIGCWNSTYSSPPTAAYFAEVEVDTETYEVKVLKFVTAMDCGKAINPMSVEGQCEGGIQNGLGAGLTENYVYDEKTGKPLSLNYTTYKMPGALDMPDETKIIIIDKPDPKGPYGAKGVGEPALVGIAPAIANAVYDAIGVRIYDQPITPEKILKAMKEKAGK
jgi:xanthine dehydrogenase molybdenum-binding subunit